MYKEKNSNNETVISPQKEVELKIERLAREFPNADYETVRDIFHGEGGKNYDKAHQLLSVVCTVDTK